MAYCKELLSKFNNVPEFKENVNVRKYVDLWFTQTECRAEFYPIFPLGTYYADKKAKERAIYEYSTSIIFALGICFLAYGLVTRSRYASALGLVALTFSAKRVSQSFIALMICPALTIRLSQKYPALSRKLPPFNYIIDRLQGHAMATGLDDYGAVTGFYVTNLALQKNGVSYDAYFINKGHKAWAIHALRGDEYPGHLLHDIPIDYIQFIDDRLNHVIVSGPSVGGSAGWPNSENIGDGFSAALQLLEQIDTTHIIMVGRGLYGGFSLAKAVERHQFQTNNIKYSAITLSAANSLGEAMEFSSPGRFGKGVVGLIGMNFTMKKMVDKLEDLGIKHLVIGHENPNSPFDEVVSDRASLLAALKEKHFMHIKLLSTSTKLYQNSLYEIRTDGFEDAVKNFLNSALDEE